MFWNTKLLYLAWKCTCFKKCQLPNFVIWHQKWLPPFLEMSQQHQIYLWFLKDIGWEYYLSMSRFCFVLVHMIPNEALMVERLIWVYIYIYYRHEKPLKSLLQQQSLFSNFLLLLFFIKHAERGTRFPANFKITKITLIFPKFVNIWLPKIMITRKQTSKSTS